MARGINRPREKAAARRAGRRKAEMEIRGTEGQEAEVEAREMEMGAKEAATEIREAETGTREAETAMEVREAETEAREAEVATEVRETEIREAEAATAAREAEAATEVREAEVATAAKEAETARWKAQGRRQGHPRRISLGGIRGRRMGAVRRVFPFRIFRSPFPGGNKGKKQENRGFYHLLLSDAVLYFIL